MIYKHNKIVITSFQLVAATNTVSYDKVQVNMIAGNNKTWLTNQMIDLRVEIGDYITYRLVIL